MDTVTSKPAELVLPVAGEPQSTVREFVCEVQPALVDELWRTADASRCGLSREEFGAALASVGERVNHGLPPGVPTTQSQKAAFFRSLHLADLALAHSCALGREVAWEVFFERFRAQLMQAAISITGSASLGEELADSLYAELYGLRQSGGERRSPLASYSGRGSLMGWLRATLVQRFRDHHRRTYREEPLDNAGSPAAAPTAAIPVELTRLTEAVARTLKGVAAEDRFLLSAYYLDRQTLLQIARTLAVHEATISRRLKRLAETLRKQLIGNLRAGGLSKAAAEEALGADPRDIEINLRRLLQTSQTTTFSIQTATTDSEPQ